MQAILMMATALLGSLMAWVAILGPTISLVLVLMMAALTGVMTAVVLIHPALTTAETEEAEAGALTMGLVTTLATMALTMVPIVGRMGLATMGLTMVAAVAIRVILGTTKE